MSIIRANVWQNTAGVARGAVINAYQSINNTTYSVGATGGFDMTSMSITLTPSSASSRFILNFNTIVSFTGGATMVFWFLRSGVDLRSLATASTYNGMAGAIVPAADRTGTCSASFIDSPNTVSPITYNVRMANDGTCFIGRRSSDNFIGVPQYFQILELAA